MATPADTELKHFVDMTVSIITNDGRNIVSGVQLAPLGLYMIRGDNIAVVGEVDEEMDGQLDLGQIRAAPIKPIGH